MIQDNLTEVSRFHFLNKKMKAQGSIEYLVIIAAVLVVSGLVIYLVTGSAGGSKQDILYGNCVAATQQCKLLKAVNSHDTCKVCENQCIEPATGEPLFPGIIECCQSGNSSGIYVGSTSCDGVIPTTCNNNGTCDAGETNTNCPGDCPVAPPTCTDVDKDGYFVFDVTDCPAGNDCNDGNASINPGAVEVCIGNVDDDCDGDIDCADSECVGSPPCVGGPELCNNGVDDDGDGDIDCDDSECVGSPPCPIKVWAVGSYPEGIYRGSIIFNLTNPPVDLFLEQYKYQTGTSADPFFSVDMLNDGQYGYAVGKSGFIGTSNGGKNWNLMGLDTGPTFAKVDILDIMNAYVVIQDSDSNHMSVFKTINAGTTWVRVLEDFADPAWYGGSPGVGPGLDFIDVNNGWVTGTKGGNGVLFSTNDGGLTWQNQLLLPGYSCPIISRSYKDIDAIDANTAWFVGTQGLICHTSDAGANWNPQPSSLPTAMLMAVDFVNENVGYVGAYEGAVIKTIDGGATWTQMDSLGNGLYDLDFLTEDIGFVATSAGSGVKNTTDGGVTWSGVPVDWPESFGNLYAIDVINDIE